MRGIRPQMECKANQKTQTGRTTGHSTTNADDHPRQTNTSAQCRFSHINELLRTASPLRTCTATGDLKGVMICMLAQQSILVSRLRHPLIRQSRLFNRHGTHRRFQLMTETIPTNFNGLNTDQAIVMPVKLQALDSINT